MKYEYVVSNSKDPYENLAFEQALLECIRDETVILYLWQNSNTIVVGKNQKIDSECRVDDFLSFGGKIARRMSGGGAVFHDSGNLNYSIICYERMLEYCKYHKILCELLNDCYRINACFNGRNDILVGEKKISGNAFYNRGGLYCQHGTILVNCDIKQMDKYLTPEKSKMDRLHIQSVKSRVTNMIEYIPDITVKQLQEDIIKFCNATLLEKYPNEGEVKRLSDFFRSDKWIYGGVE